MSQIISKRHNDFEDIYQEIMTRIFNNIDAYEKKYSIDTWVYTITRNYCIDYLKKRKISESYLDDAVHFDTKGNPADIVLRNEIHETIDRALDTFEATDRQIAYLVYFENMKYKEISVIMDININTIKTRVQKIKKQLKSALKDIV